MVFAEIDQQVKQLTGKISNFPDLFPHEQFKVEKHLVIPASPAVDLLPEILHGTGKHQFHL